MNPIVAEAIDSREKGEVPVSIATALALQGAFGTYPDRPEPVAPISEGVRQIWINLRTLVRNFYGAIAPNRKTFITPPAVAIALVEELNIIESSVYNHSNGLTSVVFYYCDYGEVVRKFPRANIRTPTTEIQRMQHTLEQQTLQQLLQLEPNKDIRRFGLSLGTGHPVSMIVTHYPVDLFNRYGFEKLFLLESHTGVIKQPAQWYTKLSNGKELDFLPFSKFTVQVFGDGNNLFSPMPNKVRQQVIDLAKQDRWTPLTTDEKIKMSLNRITHPADRTALLSLL